MILYVCIYIYTYIYMGVSMYNMLHLVHTAYLLGGGFNPKKKYALHWGSSHPISMVETVPYTRPGKRLHFANWKDPPFSMGKSTINTINHHFQ